MKVTSDMTIGELIRMDQNIIPILMRAGMHCIGCPRYLSKWKRKRSCYMKYSSFYHVKRIFRWL